MKTGKSILKITALFLIIGLNYSGLFAVGETVAYFNDKETSKNNFYTAGTLDFSLRSDQDNFEPLILAKNMKSKDVIDRDIYVRKEGNLTLRYKARSEFVSGDCDENLYNALKLKIWYQYFVEKEKKKKTGKETKGTLEEIEKEKEKAITLEKILRYDGFLKDFDDFGTNSKDPDLWIPNDHEYVDNEFYNEDEHWLAFSINLSKDISKETLQDLQNKSCEFKFVFDGWQKDPNCEESNGFIDEEEIYNRLTSSSLEINEVYEEIDTELPENLEPETMEEVFIKEKIIEGDIEIPILEDKNEDNDLEKVEVEVEVEVENKEQENDAEDLKKDVEIPVLEVGNSDDTKNSSQETEANDENTSVEKSKTDSAEDRENDTDTKDEEYVLTPKEEDLPDDDDSLNKDNDTDNSTLEQEVNSDNNNETKSGLNKNSVDCVQAIK